MTNEFWIKSSEREAFERLIQFMIQCVSSEYYDEFNKLLATYRKRAFDAGVFEAEKRKK